MVKVGISRKRFFLFLASNKHSVVIQMCVFVCGVCVCLCVPVYVKTCFKFVSCSAERKRGSASALRATSHWNSHHTPACFQLAAGGAAGRNVEKVAGLLVVCVCACIGEQWAGGGWWKRKGASWRQRKWDDPVPQYALKKGWKNLALCCNNDDFCALCLKRNNKNKSKTSQSWRIGCFVRHHGPLAAHPCWLFHSLWWSFYGVFAKFVKW